MNDERTGIEANLFQVFTKGEIPPPLSNYLVDTFLTS